MEIKCRINGVDYDAKLEQGNTFSEDYGEVLDSATIILDRVPCIPDIKPYDDVWLYTDDSLFKKVVYVYKKSLSNPSEDFSAPVGIEYHISSRKMVFTLGEGIYNSILNIYDEGDFITPITLPRTHGYYIFKTYGDYEFVVIGSKLFLKCPDNTMVLFEKTEVHNTMVFVAQANVNFEYKITDSDTQRILLISYTTNLYYTSTNPKKIKITWSSALAVLLQIFAESRLTGVYRNTYWSFNYDLNGHPFEIQFFFTKEEENSTMLKANILFTDFEGLYSVSYDGTEGLLSAEFSIHESYMWQPVDIAFSDEIKIKYPQNLVNSETVNYKKATDVLSEYDPNETYYIYFNGKYDMVGAPSSEDFENYYVFRKTFYKHFLVDQFAEEIQNLDEGIYSYTIQLFSETKGLEVVACPNLSVTEPLMYSKKISIYQYICQFLYMYSPLIKIDSPFNEGNEYKWSYARKYHLAPEIKEKFSNVYCQDFSLTNPTFRELLTELFKTLDLIPVVRDGIIYSYDKTERKGHFHNWFKDAEGYHYEELQKYVNRITGSLSSSNYTDDLRRNHQNALAQYKSGSTIEYIGFRNINSALLTMDNLEIETRFPIYKIDSMKLCYYKELSLYNAKGVVTKKYILCKQDITPIVVLNSRKGLLNQNIEAFNGALTTLNSVDTLSKYTFSTIGYDIGSKVISGFGTKYSYLVGTWDVNATLIENIVRMFDFLNPWGESINPSDFLDNQIVYYTLPQAKNEAGTFSLDFIAPSSYNNTEKIKSLFFEIEYQPFYSGSVIASKDGGRDCITHIDNTTSALALLEKDGIAQKEKINSLGNKTYVFTARYTDLSQIQELGTVYEDENVSDVIIYHKEFSVYDNVINCTYLGAKDYVLKQFFTSVYAKHRPNKLMSYDESVNRAENKKLAIVLSKNKLYYEKENNFNIQLDNFNNYDGSICALLDVFSNSSGTYSIYQDEFNFDNKINYGVFVYKGENYVSDICSFVDGKSICFNMCIPDNVIAGNYISKLKPQTNGIAGTYDTEIQNFYNDNGVSKVNDKIMNIILDKSAYIGSQQQIYLVADEDTGNGESYNFVFGNKPKENYIKSLSDSLEEVEGNLKKIQYLPKLDESYDLSILENTIKTNVLFKDNKDRLNTTVQFELTSYGEQDLFFSSFFSKLNDLMGIYVREETARPTTAQKPAWALFFGAISTNSKQKTSVGGFYNGREFVIPNLILQINKNYAASHLDSDIVLYDGAALSMTQKVPDNILTSSSLSSKRQQIWSAMYAGSHAYHPTYFISELRMDVTKIEYESGTNTLKLSSSLTFTKNCFEGRTSPDPLYTIDTGDKVTTTENNVTLSLKYSGEDNNNKYYQLVSKHENYDVDIFPEWDASSSQYTDFSNLELGMYNSNNTQFVTPTGKDLYWVGEFNENASFKTVLDDKYYTLKRGSLYGDSIPGLNTMLLVYSTEYINQDIEYKEIKYEVDENDNFINNFASPLYPITDTRVSQVFSVDLTGISVNLNALSGKPYYNDLKSIQYWYYDKQSGSYKFVFGVNLTESEKNVRNTHIYASLVRNKDTRVFDQNGQIVGEVKNYVGRLDTFYNNPTQTYTPKDNT